MNGIAPHVTLPVRLSITEKKGLYAQLGHGLDDLGIVVRFPAREGDISILQRIQPGFGDYRASCSVGTWRYVSGTPGA
jgi:hypothetical protein